MRTLPSWAAFVALLLFVSPALAQPGPDEVGVFFDPAGTQVMLNITPFVPFSFYVVAQATEDLEAFEFSISVPPSITVLGAFGGPIICIDPTRCGPLDWQIGVTCTGPGTLQLVEVQCLMLAPDIDLPICVGPIDPPHMGPGGLGYVNCLEQYRALGLFAGWPNLPGCGVVNPTVVGTGIRTWSNVKSRFDP